MNKKKFKPTITYAEAPQETPVVKSEEQPKVAPKEKPVKVVEEKKD